MLQDLSLNGMCLYSDESDVVIQSVDGLCFYMRFQSLPSACSLTSQIRDY